MLFRILSALVGLPIIFSVVVLPPQFLLAFCCLVASLGNLELSRLLTRINVKSRIVPSLIITIITVLNGYFANQFLLEILCLSLGISAAFFLRQPFTRSSVVDSLATFASPFILGIPFSLILVIRAMDGGISWIIFILLVTFGTDSFAYFAGKLFGRRRMAKTISPSKTLEGAFGGLMGGLILGTIWGGVSVLNLPLWYAVFFGLTLSVSGQIGDLLESAFKRAVDVKDSGGLIPGHGGILDRVDSVALNTVVAYYLIVLAGFIDKFAILRIF